MEMSGQIHAPAGLFLGKSPPPPGIHLIGGWVNPRAALDSVAKRKILCPSRESRSGHPARSLVTLLTELPHITQLTHTIAVDPEDWTLRIPKPSTGYDSEPVISTSYPHHQFLWSIEILSYHLIYMPSPSWPPRFQYSDDTFLFVSIQNIRILHWTAFFLLRASFSKALRHCIVENGE
jgi:hypothetical protein